MFIIQKIFSNFLLSPMFLVVLLIVVALFIHRLKLNQIKRIFLFLAIIVYLLSIEPVKDLFVIPLESKNPQISMEELELGDAYVLLGGGVHQGIMYPSEVALGRITEVVRLYRISPKKIIVSGGIVYNGSVSEAEVYKNFLIDLGVRQTDIILEERSRSTKENAKYSKEILDQLNVQNIVLVTSATHMERAKISFARVGLNVFPAPGVFISDYSSYDISSFMPSYKNLEVLFRAIWEYVGLIYYNLG